MKKEILICTLFATAALGACDNSDHTIVAGERKDENPVAKIDPATLPPAIVASKIYRCKDNSVVYIDWLADNSANFRADKAATPTKLAAPAEAGKALTAEGYSLTGSASASSITLERPGKGSQSCKA